MREDRLFYAPARPGCRRIEDDARTVTQVGGTADPPVRRPPAGMLLAATVETAALEALRADEAEANAPATVIEVTAEDAARRFGPQAVAAVRRMARRERSAATPRSVREWAAAELRKLRAAARATAPGERWTSTTAESETLAAAYVREGEPPGIRLYATAPYHPWLHTRATALELPAERVPTIRIESYGADGTRVLIDNVETRMLVRDLATTVAVAASQASGLRAGPVGVRVLEQAGRILENGNGRAPGSLGLTTRSARCREPCVEEGWDELLVTLLTRQAGLRDQQGADAYGETRPCELDVEATGGEPAVLRGDTATATLLTEAGELSLNERAARPIRTVAERIQARSGADEFWIDADTSTRALESVRPTRPHER